MNIQIEGPGKANFRSLRGRVVPIALSVGALVALGGCSSFSQMSDPERSEQVLGIDKHSSYPAVRRSYFEKVNILELVDPDNRAPVMFHQAWEGAKNLPADDNKVGVRYDLALSAFRQRDDISATEKRRRRNAVQERIISVAVSRCNVFKTYLRRDQSNQNFLLGSLTTVSGTLGAIMNGVNASRNLAGMAGIFSGIRSEYNQAYYSNLAAHVIVKGIETKQETVYRRIQSEGQNKSIDDYPMEAAIKDALYFDGLCSVVTGLDQASASVDATLEPGLDAATRTLLRARLAREAMDMPREQLLNPQTLDRIGLAGHRLGMSLVGSARGEPVPDANDIDLFVAASRLVERALAAGDATAAAINQAATAQREKLIAQATPDAAKGYRDKAAKTDILAAVKSQLRTQLYDVLALDSCYMKIAAPAVEERIKAIKARDAATTDAARISADHKIALAVLEVQRAHERLRQTERLIVLDLNAYETQRVAAIEIQAIDDVLDSAKVTGAFTLAAAKGQNCK